MEIGSIGRFPTPLKSTEEWAVMLEELKLFDEAILHKTYPLSALTYRCPLYLNNVDDSDYFHTDPIVVGYNHNTKDQLIELVNLTLEGAYDRDGVPWEEIAEYIEDSNMDIKPVIIKQLLEHILFRKKELSNTEDTYYMSDFIINARGNSSEFNVHVDAALVNDKDIFVYVIKNSNLIPTLNDYVMGTWLAISHHFPGRNIYICPIIFSDSEIIIGSYWVTLLEDVLKLRTIDLVDRFIGKLTKGFINDINDKEKLLTKLSKYKSQKCKYCIYECG
jgi:hypothetical protein